MKRADDPRHKIREKAVQELFAYSFKQHTDLGNLSKSVIKTIPKIDSLISDCATEWPISKINKIDLAILRLSIFELLDAKNPQKVVIDEAVELAKTFGSTSSPSFINGVLGTTLKIIKQKHETKN